MTRIDAAKAAFDRIKAYAVQNESKIITESDARLHLIDQILIDVLGWPREGISTEPQAGSGFIDYLLSLEGKRMLVVEAKRTSIELVSTKLPAFRFYKVGGSALKDAHEGFEQAVGYSSRKSVPFACLTNGLAWIGFRPIRMDGIEYTDGQAATFPSLDSISENFAAFYDLFSTEGLTSKLYSIYCDQAEGSAISNISPIYYATRPDEIHLLQKNELARDMEQVFDEFFKNIADSTDEELLLHCFVESPESREADRSLEKITRNLVDYVETIKSRTGAALTQQIQLSIDSKRGQIVLIVGNKGSGKSTFLQRFFKHQLEKKIRDKCLILKADLGDYPGSIDKLSSWLTDSLIDAAENSLYDGKSPGFDELQGIFFDTYQRWSTGEFKHLHDSDLTAFKTKFGEYIVERRRDKPYEYLTSILKRTIRQRGQIPCLLFDNADNFPSDFQDAVFQYAHALHRLVALSLLVVPITDKTIWRLSKSGALQSYAAKSLYLPIPSTKGVLEKRLGFIRRKIEEGPDQSHRYFSSKGIRIKLENIPAFAACVEEAFIATDFISRRVGALSNYDLRRTLELSQKIITAPIMRVDELVTAYFSTRTINITERRIVQALLYGNYNRFKQDSNAFILNLFTMEQEVFSSPLLRLSVLRYLIDRKNAATDDFGTYLDLATIIAYMENSGVAAHTTKKALEHLKIAGLVETYDPNAEEIFPTTTLAITAAGHHHFWMAFNDKVYIEQMALCTGLRSDVDAGKLRGIMGRRMKPVDWDEIRIIFSRYCLGQDKKFISIPAHESYDSQREMRAEFDKWTS
jgi:energy-coupling factor transporter ATP-binding protein EcfA2